MVYYIMIKIHFIIKILINHTDNVDCKIFKRKLMLQQILWLYDAHYVIIMFDPFYVVVIETWPHT